MKLRSFHIRVFLLLAALIAVLSVEPCGLFASGADEDDRPPCPNDNPGGCGGGGGGGGGGGAGGNGGGGGPMPNPFSRKKGGMKGGPGGNGTGGGATCSTCPAPAGGKTDGGNRKAPSEAQPPLATTNGLSSTTGDPFSVGHGYVLRNESDFDLSILYGLDLNIHRLYSSTINSWTMYDRYDLGMYGIGWFSPYEMRITPSGYDEFDEPVAFVFVDGEGYMHHLEYYDTNEWRARLDQGEPFILLKTGSGSSASYVLDGTDYRQWGFDYQGRITYYDDNVITRTVERLNFEYDGSDRLWKVSGSGSEDRYLEFYYNNGTYSRRCTEIHLVAGLNDYNLIEYGYNGSGKLFSVKRNPGNASSTHEYQYLYEYGDFDVISGIPTWSPGSTIGRVSYRLDQEASPYRPLVAYKYGIAYAVEKEFVFDVELVTPAWRQTLYFTGFMFNHNPTLSLGDSTSDPTTTFITDYKNDVADVIYSNTTHKMPPTHFFGAEDPSAGGSGDQDYTRLIGSLQLQDGSSSWYPVWEVEYDFANSDYMLRYRKLSSTAYANSSPSSSMITTFSYDSVFEQWTDLITDGEAESTSYSYGTNPYIAIFPIYIFDPRYGRITSFTVNGLTTTYMYHLSGSSEGLVYSITDPYGNITYYDHDSRGNITSITNPDGNVISKTYNDFGQVLSESTTNLDTLYIVYSDGQYLHDGVSVISSDEKYIPPRPIQVVDYQGNFARYHYTESGKLWKATDAKGDITEYTYDRRGRQISAENGEGDVVTYHYDEFDRLISFIDGRNKQTSFEYDVYGRLTKETDADSQSKEFSYADDMTAGCGCGGSGTNKVSRIKQQDGKFIHFSYDLVGRLDKMWYSPNATLTTGELSAPHLIHTYDRVSRLISVTDTRLTLAGNSYSFEYDTGNTGRITRIVHPEGYTQEFFYEDDDQEPNFRRLVAYKDVDGHIVKYAVDSLQRPETIIDGYGNMTEYTYSTASDTSFPVGAIKQIKYGNGTENNLTYNPMGQIQKIEYLNSSATAFDYVDLRYDAAGLIKSKKRKLSSSHYTTNYTYDSASRLISEEIMDGSNVEKSAKVYDYDAASNRILMAFGNDSLSTKSTTYNYGNRQEIISNTGYYKTATTDSGNISYTWDSKGNMLTRTGQTFEWNQDNYLSRAWVSGGDPKAELFQKFFKYDYSGRRILEFKNIDGVRERMFFNGLTEEIRKISVGVGADTSFARTVKITSASSETSWVNWGSRSWHEWDNDRMSIVTKTVNEEANGKTWWESGDGWNITGKRTFSVWAKSSIHGAHITICVKATDGTRYGLVYQGSTTTPYNSGNAGFLTIAGTGGDFTNGNWTRLERDLQTDLTNRFGKTLANVTGIYLWSGGTSSPYLYIDDVSFSNSLTVEHNTLNATDVSRILRHTKINSTTYAQSDRWFHYDQVGSVMAESDDAGTLVQAHYQDSFGNTQANWNAGLLGGDKEGWHHNTREFDNDIGATYMYQRWYLAELPSFMSTSIYPGFMEHHYSFVGQQPISKIDPTGLWMGEICLAAKAGGCIRFGKCWGNRFFGVGVGVGYGASATFSPTACPSAISACPMSSGAAAFVELDVNAALGGGVSGGVDAAVGAATPCSCTTPAGSFSVPATGYFDIIFGLGAGVHGQGGGYFWW